MVFFEKSRQAPKSLAKHRSYRGADVLELLQNDFKNKCYICETKAPVCINVEHFHSHKGDKTLMFDWNNLFFACSHCNMTKAICEADDNFRNVGILNCTIKADCVGECISYRVDTLYETTKVLLKKEFTDNIADSERIDNTIKLLDLVYNGYEKPVKTKESENLLFHLLEELNDFYIEIEAFRKNQDNRECSHLLKEKIFNSLDNDSAFTAFKRWIIKDNKELYALLISA